MSANQFVHRYNGDMRELLAPVANAPTITWTPQLVFAPGYFAYNEFTYDLTRPGLYRFCAPGVNTTHMIVFGGDVLSLLSSLAWLTTFGQADRQLVGETETAFLARVSAQARTSKLRLLCESTCTFAKKAVLDPAGVNSRLVRFLTMETPNNVVDGHVCLEATINGSRTLVDLHNNVAFHDANDNQAAAKDVPALIAGDLVSRVWLSHEGAAVEVFSNSMFDATGYADAYLLSRSDVALWQHRIFQAVGMTAPNGETWWLLPDGHGDRQAWVESLSTTYKVKDKATWMGAFYA